MTVSSKITMLALLCVSFAPRASAAAVSGWLNWRGPNQDGVSGELSLPETCDPNSRELLWCLPVSGRGTPVVAGKRLYAMAYRGEGEAVHELVICVDADTGKLLWEYRCEDFLSDIIYKRYAIGAPCIDPESGNVYVLSSSGLARGFTPEGKVLWEHSMMEEFGRLTFPNGRTGSPVVEGELVIMRGVTANWGAQGPASDRFYAFDKKTGDLVWVSTPGASAPPDDKTAPVVLQPKDNSMSTPVFASLNGKRVFYVAIGSGDVVCVNARNGEPLWRLPIAKVGVNTTVALYNNCLIAAHGGANLDNSQKGRMVAIRVGAEPAPGQFGPLLLEKDAEIWRNEDICAFSSSPVVVGKRIYQTVETGELFVIDAETGKALGEPLKLGIEQLHASPASGAGKLYAPFKAGEFHVLDISGETPKILKSNVLQGECIGAPAICNGRVYVLTTERLYAFGKVIAPVPVAAPTAASDPVPGPPVSLRVLPAEVLLSPQQGVKLRVQAVDAHGYFVRDVSPSAWEKWVPPYARVRSHVNLEFPEPLQVTATADQTGSAGMFRTEVSGMTGYLRGRVLQALPLVFNFEAEKFRTPDAWDMNTMPVQATEQFAYPPLSWIGARLKWIVVEHEGGKVLRKLVDPDFKFPRAVTFFGTPAMSKYTIAADVMTGGNRRKMSEVGVINQRYLVVMKGNSQCVEVTSNLEAFRHVFPFQVLPNTWYRLKSRVDVAPDGAGVIRVKIWKRAEAEPEAWLAEVKHGHAFRQGSPGIYGLTPVDQPVYVDNISVTSNE